MATLGGALVGVGISTLVSLGLSEGNDIILYIVGVATTLAGTFLAVFRRQS